MNNYYKKVFHQGLPLTIKISKTDRNGIMCQHITTAGRLHPHNIIKEGNDDNKNLQNQYRV